VGRGCRTQAFADAIGQMRIALTP
jgi:hypothetical protein